jgi:hypothetical protein
MDDWYDVFSVVSKSLEIAGAAALIIGLIVYCLFRLVRFIPKFRRPHPWISDLRPIGITAGIIFVLVLFPSIFIGWMFSDMCGTSHITEVLSPDRKYKIAVYNFDCGATTDFSLDVSLLNARKKVPKYRIPEPLLYSNYGQLPQALGAEKNFNVIWLDATHVTVQIAHYKGEPANRKQDDIEIRLERLP